MNQELPDCPRQFLNPKPSARRDVQRLFQLVLIAGTVALVAAGYASLTNAMEALYARAREHSFALAVFIGLVGLGAGAALTHGAPAARGSGIPQILRVLENHPDQLFLLSARTAVIKVISSMLGLLGGASLGREGPTLQISACVAIELNRLSARTLPLAVSFDAPSCLVIGSCVGLAAAFNTPLAGLCFALEELLEGDLRAHLKNLLPALGVGGLIAHALKARPYFGEARVEGFGTEILWLSLIVGISGGLLGGTLSQLLQLSQRRQSQIPIIPRVLLCALICAGINQLTDGATAGSGFIPANQALNGPLPLQIHPLYFLAKSASLLASYTVGMAGGIFAPILSIGAGLGQSIHEILPGNEPKAAVLLGMVAVFSGVVQAPLTATLLVLEMTDERALTLPFLVTALGAQAMARLIAPIPLYRALMQWVGVPKPAL